MMHFISVKFVVFVICLNAFQKDIVASDTHTSSSEESVNDNFASGLKVMYRAYEQCENTEFGDIFTCLKLRALKFADRLLRSDSVHVIDGINIVKSSSKATDRNGRKVNFDPLPEVNEAVLPTDPEQKQDKLNEMLIERLARFFQIFSVQFDMSRLMVESKKLLDDYPEEQGMFSGILLRHLFIYSSVMCNLTILAVTETVVYSIK
jgi:hypothetical protein